jgi:hypothetical protein
MELEMRMDWKKHHILVEVEPNVRLCPQQPFVEQLHTNLERLVRYVQEIAAVSHVARTELLIRWRDEIYADAQLLEKARAFLGVGPSPARKYARGQRQDDLALRFGVLPECHFVVREIWPGG